MSLYVLDTDHTTLLGFGHPKVVAHLQAVSVEELATTIITVEEHLRAWFTQVRKARDAVRLTRAYQGLLQVIEIARSVRVLPFSRTAVDRYLDLRKSLPRMGKHDLAIAAIVLEFDGTVVTRNRRDFEQVPDLPIQDWSV
jgi:tRNA(fMet)-specific endonuclease VapC